MNLANSRQFPRATVSTHQDFETSRIRQVIDNDENTCTQLSDDEKWLKIWLGSDVNVGTITVKSNTPGEFELYTVHCMLKFTNYNSYNFYM